MSKLKRLKFTSCFFDSSGYGTASRKNALALLDLGVELTLNPVTFENTAPDLGKVGERLKALVHKDIEYDAHLIQLTPEHVPIFKKPGEKTILYTVWETDRLYPSWSGYINQVDKAITGSHWGRDVFVKSGVTVPVGVCSHCVDPLTEKDFNSTYSIPGLSPNTYVFGDIFQWVEKKSPLSLIKTYWATFTKKDDVALVLKTYRSDFSEVERESIRTTIKRLKEVSHLDYYPPIYLILDQLSDEQINALQNRFDCYISLDKGEGVGLGPMRAGSFGKPIIITGWGGSTEYAKPDNSYLVPYTMEPCFGMPYCPWVRGDQWWAAADLQIASKYMRYVFENRNEAKVTGKFLQRHLNTHFSYDAIGKKLIQEIEEIL